MRSLDSITILPCDDAIRILAEHYGLCGSCGKPSFIFINRDGRTRCAHCDKREMDKQ